MLFFENASEVTVRIKSPGKDVKKQMFACN